MATGKYAVLLQPFCLILFLILSAAGVITDSQGLQLCTNESNKLQLNVNNIATEEMYVTTTDRLNLSCKEAAEFIYLWKCSNATWQNLRFNMENNSVCHSAPGEISCDIDLDAKCSNYLFCCSKANFGSPNVATKCFNITVRVMPPSWNTTVIIAICSVTGSIMIMISAALLSVFCHYFYSIRLRGKEKQKEKEPLHTENQTII